MYVKQSKLTQILAMTILIIIASFLTACNAGVKSSDKAMTSYSINGVDGVITNQNISVTLPHGTNVTALIATFTATGTEVAIGGATQVSGVTSNNFTSSLVYTVTAEDNSTISYTVTVTVSPSSDKTITAYSINGIDGVITGESIVVDMPNGTNVSALVASFTTTGVRVSVNGITQISESTVNNFTNPLIYTVTANDGSTIKYTVTVSVEPSFMTAITHYSLNNVPGIILGKSIIVNLPYKTDTANLIATFATTGVSVSVNGNTQISGVTANNFADPVLYTVSSNDGTTAIYTVRVIISPLHSKTVTAYSLNGRVGVIEDNNIAIAMPYNVDLSALTATFTTTGTSVSINGVTQASGITTHDFTKPVVYTVTAGDGTTANYTVTVTKVPYIVYITNGVHNNVSQCTLDQTTGALANCGVTGDIFKNPMGIAVNNGFAYIVNNESATVTQCKINTITGIFSNCVSTGANTKTYTGVSYYNHPTAITINNGFAYILNQTGNSVTQCIVNQKTGALTNCIVSNELFDSPMAVTVNNGYLYVANNQSDSVSKCTVDTTTGSLNNCTTTGTGFNKPSSIVISSEFAYITNQESGTITKCSVDSTSGVLSSCAQAASGFFSPAGIAISNGVIYITNQSNGTISKCSFDKTTGTVSNCGVDSTQLQTPLGIIIH
ncbi:MAG: trimeric autotransporter adhesin [Pseudomonadota bacterium]|nr:trimeric autotransporter adhesin [Pseudomonadota bacterium]